MNANIANNKRITLEEIKDKVLELQEEIKTLDITESWESQVVRDAQRHLKNLELTISDHVESLNEIVYAQIRKNMATVAEWEKTADQAEICERYDGECTICPRGNTCGGH